MGPPPPDPLDVRAFRSRLTGLAAIKDADWLERQRARSVAERLEAAFELRAWAHRARPDLDWESLREEDLQSHARMAALLRRVDARLAG